jgi:hypothetical protein
LTVLLAALVRASPLHSRPQRPFNGFRKYGSVSTLGECLNKVGKCVISPIQTDGTRFCALRPLLLNVPRMNGWRSYSLGKVRIVSVVEHFCPHLLSPVQCGTIAMLAMAVMAATGRVGDRRYRSLLTSNAVSGTAPHCSDSGEAHISRLA